MKLHTRGLMVYGRLMIFHEHRTSGPHTVQGTGPPAVAEHGGGDNLDKGSFRRRRR